jgi:hypothetical protein
MLTPKVPVRRPRWGSIPAPWPRQTRRHWSFARSPLPTGLSVSPQPSPLGAPEFTVLDNSRDRAFRRRCSRHRHRFVRPSSVRRVKGRRGGVQVRRRPTVSALSGPVSIRRMDHHSVSCPSSSNRTCGFPASGSRTGFTPGHAQVAQAESAEAGTPPTPQRRCPRKSAPSLAMRPCAAAAKSDVRSRRRSYRPPGRP